MWIFLLQEHAQPIGHYHVAQVAFDLAAVLIAVAAQRQQAINRRRLELRFRALVRHFSLRPRPISPPASRATHLIVTSATAYRAAPPAFAIRARCVRSS